MIKWEETALEHNGNDTKTKKCVVIIPVYKKELSSVEKASLKQVVNILGYNYELVLVCPKSLDISNYNSTANYNFSLLRCSDGYFVSQRSYSDLCEEWQFYSAFSEYEFMVIYQLDAWVFEDRLEYFINLGYDYIGAPHLVGIKGKDGENGNGGFCLRRIKVFLDVCKKTDFSNFRALEDCVFTQNLKSNFKLAPLDICRQFSFQESPQIQFEKNGNKLPMGCHAFMRFNKNFWKSYIKTSAWEEEKINNKEVNTAIALLMSSGIDGINHGGIKNNRLLASKRRIIKKIK